MFIVYGYPTLHAQIEQVIAHPWTKGTSGWCGDIAAPMRDAVEVRTGGVEY